MTGNVYEWMNSLWGQARPDFGFHHHYAPPAGPKNIKPYAYPYDPQDGREGQDAGGQIPRVVRGGSFI